MLVSLIIPTLNAGEEIGVLLGKIAEQELAPDEVVVVDSSSEDNTLDIVERFGFVKTVVIDRRDFNHGLTRDKALRASTGDIVCFMTQDAIPANSKFLKNLISPLIYNREVAISSGRQLPKTDARRFEQLVRAFNYPAESRVCSLDDIPILGIKTYFATDVCAAYRRTSYLELGGFEKTDMSEDMLMAAKAINAGWKVAYAADAEVYHSHNLTFRQQYERNRAIGRFLERNAGLILCASEVGEGSRLAKTVAKALIKERNISELLAFTADCVARLAGNRSGRSEVKKVGR